MQYKTLSRDQAVVRYGGIKHEGKRASVFLIAIFSLTPYISGSSLPMD